MQDAGARLIPSSWPNFTPPHPLPAGRHGRRLVDELARAYSERYKHVTISVEGRGSFLGIELVRQGEVDIGMASWKELDDTSLWSTPIALDGIAIIVHPHQKSGYFTKRLLSCRKPDANKILLSEILQTLQRR